MCEIQLGQRMIKQDNMNKRPEMHLIHRNQRFPQFEHKNLICFSNRQLYALLSCIYGT